MLVEELEQLSDQIVVLQRELDAIDVVSEHAQSKLRCLERQAMLRGTKATDAEYRQLCDTDHELEEALRKATGGKTPGSEVRLDKLLDEALSTEKEP